MPGSTTWWRSEDWQLLPEVLPGKDSVNLDSQAEGRLQRAGYIVGNCNARDLSRPGDQGHQLERDRTGHRPRWDPAALGLPALLQGRSALNQLAGPDLRGDAPGHW